MDLTDVTAAYGAVVGTVGAAVGLATRVDVRWRRRARIVEEVRPALRALRDVLAEAQAQPKASRALRSPRVRADLQLVDEARARTADRTLGRQLARVHQACAVVAAAPSAQDGGAYAVATAVTAALGAVNDALGRLDQIDRKAPV